MSRSQKINLYTHILKDKPPPLTECASPQAVKTAKVECGGVLSYNPKLAVYGFCYAVFAKIKSFIAAQGQREGNICPTLEVSMIFVAISLRVSFQDCYEQRKKKTK